MFTCRFRKLHPLEWRRQQNHNIIAADDRNCRPFRSHVARLLQVATPARSRNPGSAASTQCPKAARATSIAFALGAVLCSFGSTVAVLAYLTPLPSSGLRLLCVGIEWALQPTGDGNPVRSGADRRSAKRCAISSEE